MIGKTNASTGGSLAFNGALIHIIAPTGSTISITKDNLLVTTLYPKDQHVSNNNNTHAEWYYSVSSINYGTWIISADIGNDDIITETINVNDSRQYNVILYKFYLWREGYGLMHDFTKAAGGVDISGTDKISFTSNIYGFCLQPTIDFSKYSTLCCELTVNSVDSDTYKPTFGIASNTNVPTNSGSDAKFIVKYMVSKVDQRTIYALDISPYSQTAYFKFTEYYFRGAIYNIWLEY